MIGHQTHLKENEDLTLLDSPLIEARRAKKKIFWRPLPPLSQGMESGILPIFAVQSGILAFGIQNAAQGIRNQSKDWYPESKFH